MGVRPSSRTEEAGGVIGVSANQTRLSWLIERGDLSTIGSTPA